MRDGYADGLTCVDIAEAVAQRTPSAVAARARKRGLATYARRWTATDDAGLARVLAVRSIDEAARLLGRTPEAVRRRARKLGIAASGPVENERGGERWTAGEDELLVLHAALNPAVLAALLGRSDEAIADRLRRLGLRAGRRRSPHHPSPSNGGLTQVSGLSSIVSSETGARARCSRWRSGSTGRSASSPTSLGRRRG